MFDGYVVFDADWYVMLILLSYYASNFLIMFFIESPCVKIPHEPNIVDFLGSGEEE